MRKRAGMLRIAKKVLHEALKLPDDVSIQCMEQMDHIDFYSGSLTLILEGGNLPEVEEGEKLPMFVDGLLIRDPETQEVKFGGFKY